MTGPSGCGKTQLCIMLSVLATLPRSMGGLDSGVIFIDTESAFSAERCSTTLLSLSLSCELFVFSPKLTIYLSKIGRNGTGQIPRILLGEGASDGDGVSCSSLQGTDLSGRPE